MQLLDDDMDELFRKAASQYPLKTDGSDWDAVMRRLPQADNKQVSAFNRLRDSRWLKWLLGSSLTLLVIILCVPALRMGVLPTEKGSGVTTNDNNITSVSDNKTDKNINTTSESDSKTGKSISTTSVSVNDSKTGKSNNTTSVPVNDSKTGKSISTTTISDNKTGKDNSTTSVSENDSKIVNKTNPPIVLAAIDVFNLHLLSTADQKKHISAQLQSGGNLIKLRQDTTVRPAKVKVPVQKGLYIGIVASPDFSTVKGQKVSNVGYNAGVIAGYRISRHLAVETGVLLERKYYYSEGKYFSTKKINPPADMKIINVDGWCKMIEIPLNVRYVFNIKPKSNWYVNAGVSSYIMSKESYDYKYERYNTISTRNWSYNNATRNWFSIIHAGVGYEHRLGGIGTLRVEPYLKVPAGGVGIGNLPLTSVGLNIGITKPIRF